MTSIGRRDGVIIGGLYLAIYVVPLGLRPIAIPDEARYAEVSREIRASDDWVVPRLDGLRYFEKPILGYWITAASFSVFGENAFAARLPSALAVGVTSLVLYFLVRKCGGHDSIAVVVAAVFLTFLEVFVVGTLCLLDSALSLFITGEMVSFFCAYKAESRGRMRWLLALCGVSCGLGFLTKGFVAVAIPLVAILPFLYWEGRSRAVISMGWLPALVAAIVVIPWAGLIYGREGDFWHFFLWNEHIRRLAGADAQHAEPFWDYLVLLPIAALPWTFVAWPAVGGLRKSLPRKELIRFSLCWLVFPILFLSLCRGKLVTYVLPCFPPLAILMAAGLYHYAKAGRYGAFTRGTLLMIAVLSVGAGVLVRGQVGGLHSYSPYSTNWQWVALLTGIGLWLGLLLLSCVASTWGKKVALYTVAPIPLLAASSWLVPDQLVEHKMPGALLMRNANRIHADTILVADIRSVHAVCWFFRRSDVYLFRGPGELEYGLNYGNARYRLLNHEQLMTLILNDDRPEPITVIGRRKDYLDWGQRLPPPRFVDGSGKDGYVFVQY